MEGRPEQRNASDAAALAAKVAKKADETKARLKQLRLKHHTKQLLGKRQIRRRKTTW